MATYLEKLKRLTAERIQQRAEERARQSRPLHQKIEEYFDSIPPHSRKASYTMDELVILFGTSAGLIGVALHRLGWERKRRWNSGGAFTRYWVPPSADTA